jgi:hypothetical protein
MDFSIKKNFRVAEGISMEVQGVFAKVFKHNQFLGPDGFFVRGLFSDQDPMVSEHGSAVRRRKNREATGRSKSGFAFVSSLQLKKLALTGLKTHSSCSAVRL